MTPSLRKVFIAIFSQSGNEQAGEQLACVEKMRFEKTAEKSNDGSNKVSSPVPATDHKAKVAAARAKINARHQKAFKKLAEKSVAPTF